MVWDLSNFANLYQTIDGTTTPVTATGQSVGYVKDLSPNANHWKAAANDTTRPTLQQDSDGKYYLSFDGSNDVLLAPAPFVAATSAATLAFTSVVGIFGAAQSATKTLLSTNSTTNAVPFIVPMQSSGTTTSLVAVGRDDAAAGGTAGLWPTLTALDSTKRVITSAWAGPTVATDRMRDAASRPSGGGTGSYNSSSNNNCVTPLSITRSGLGANCASAPANFFAGRIYSGFVINRYLTDAEVKTGENWAATRCLVSTLP
jgi:hypothetical protein